MRNGNVAQGAVVNGTFEGQGLHFRWGDGTVFKCKDLTICFENNRLVRANGTFSTRKSNSRRRNRRKNGRIVEFDDGWTVGGTIYFLNGDVRRICILNTIQSRFLVGQKLTYLILALCWSKCWQYNARKWYFLLARRKRV